MPNAKVLSEKQAIVEALTERIQNASAGVLVDYKGITVADDTKLRRELRENGITYSVVKNTLTRFALDKLGMNELDSVLNGTTALATSAGDPIAPIRILSEYAEKSADCFNIKATFMDGKVLDETEIKEIAALPSKDALYAQVFGTLLAPITSLAVVLNEIAKKQGYTEPEAAPEAAE
ncbi:MAG: 50S ribosomal protein L10 [Oscillospiraceae bacterium]|nr:50S ribosomal protein L10 [Oscillospiraceae bacterium]